MPVSRYSKPARWSFLATIIVSAFLGGILSLIFNKSVHISFVDNPKPSQAPGDLAAEKTYSVTFNPPQLQEAPADIRDAVMLGYNILMDTPKYAPQYVGNKLSCKNCHFEAGRTMKGLSLVGVGAVYPKYKERHHYSVNLVMRTNDCFERSMNGKALPSDSKEMNAIITYYQWISKGLPIYADIPWLRLEPIKSSHGPNPTKGKEVYDQKCMACHGNEGQGTPIAPPLWGKDSFNDGAGMAELPKLAAFAHAFMPQGNPNLTTEEALDVSVFVTGQPRPHFLPKRR